MDRLRAVSSSKAEIAACGVARSARNGCEFAGSRVAAPAADCISNF
jgi:hypothetical protein